MKRWLFSFMVRSFFFSYYLEIYLIITIFAPNYQLLFAHETTTTINPNAMLSDDKSSESMG